MALKPLIAGMAPSKTSSGGGATIAHTTNLIAGDGAGNGGDSGKSVSQIGPIALPAWTWVAGGGVPASGKFTTDSADPTLVTTINFSVTSKNGSSLPWDAILPTILLAPSAALLLLTDATGKSAFFSVSGVGGMSVSVSLFGTPADYAAFTAGDYSLSLWLQRPSLEVVFAQSGVSPIADGNYNISGTLGGTVSISHGIITAWTPAA